MEHRDVASWQPRRVLSFLAELSRSEARAALHRHPWRYWVLAALVVTGRLCSVWLLRAVWPCQGEALPGKSCSAERFNGSGGSGSDGFRVGLCRGCPWQTSWSLAPSGGSFRVAPRQLGHVAYRVSTVCRVRDGRDKAVIGKAATSRSVLRCLGVARLGRAAGAGRLGARSRCPCRGGDRQSRKGVLSEAAVDSVGHGGHSNLGCAVAGASRRVTQCNPLADRGRQRFGSNVLERSGQQWMPLRGPGEAVEDRSDASMRS